MLCPKLGKTDVAVSTIALGAMTFAAETPEEDAFAEASGHLIVTAAVDVGGASDPLLGRWLTPRPCDRY